MSKFWVLYFYEIFIGYRYCFNLNFYMSKKVQKNFLFGLKFGEVGGRDHKFQNPKVSTVFNFSCKTSKVKRRFLLVLSKKYFFERFFLKVPSLARSCEMK